jgi:S-adenosyl-L-methionine hydrolase (adenosine-forming)
MSVILPPFRRPTITFMSDFGWSSTGVGIMKAVALGICPDAQIIDVTHEITPFSVIDGACGLETLISFPPDAIHVCVVDPGVGSNRRIVALATNRGDILVGPDNGVLLPASRKFGGITRSVVVSNEKFLLKRLGSTFDGRDVMAPAAAAIANGNPVNLLGQSIAPEDLYPAPYNEAAWNQEDIEAIVIHVNRYGSVYLNVDNASFRAKGFVRGAKVLAFTSNSKQAVMQVCSAFSDVPRGDCLIFEGHFGRVQAAVNSGSLADKLALQLGTVISLRLTQ